MRTAYRASIIFALLLPLGGVALATGCASVQRPDGGEGLLPAGESAPDVTGKDQSGKTVRLRGLVGKPVVVFFYPKDGTPGCTREVCAFRDAWDRYVQAGVVVIGVSKDSSASHGEFAKDHELPFSLVADEGGRWLAAFGVGAFLGMASRVSFLIGPDGKIAKVYPDVDPGVHATETLRDAERLGLTSPMQKK